MSYLGTSVLMLFLLAITSVGWYWLFKRFERRVSDRFNDISERVNENFRIIEMIIGRIDEMPIDLLQGLLLVIKQDRAIDAALRAGKAYREEGAISPEEYNKFTKLLADLRLDNLSRY